MIIWYSFICKNLQKNDVYSIFTYDSNGHPYDSESSQSLDK